MKCLTELARYRVRHPTMGWGDKDGGCFRGADLTCWEKNGQVCITD